MAKDITLRDVINHMQMHASQALAERTQLGKRIDDLDRKLTKRIDVAEKRLTDEIRGIDDMDYRLQEIEDQDLPKRVTGIEKKLQLTK